MLDFIPRTPGANCFVFVITNKIREDDLTGGLLLWIWRDSPLVRWRFCREADGMNPLVFIIPVLIATSGVVCFFVLPMPLNVRLAIMVADLVAAGVVALVLYRRFGR